MKTPDAADGAACYQAAKTLRCAGRMGEAAQYYQRAVGFQEHFYPAWIEGCDSLLRAGRVEDALVWARHAVDGHRQTRLLYASLALAEAHCGDIPRAMQFSDISLDTERPWYAVCARGEILLRAKPCSKEHRKLALECFDEAVRLADDPWEVFYICGTALFDAGWPAHAAGYFSEAAHYNPLAAASWVGLGDCFHNLGLHEQASFYCDRALELNPLHETARSKRVRYRRAVFGLLQVFEKKESLMERWAARYNLPIKDPAKRESP